MGISIHSPHTGRDRHHRHGDGPVPDDISIHSPHTGRDASATMRSTSSLVFQSTLPTRGETGMQTCASLTPLFQSTLPTRGETGAKARLAVHGCEFQSTLPTRGETIVAVHGVGDRVISIHSPHTGRDGHILPKTGRSDHISIHSPHTGRDGGYAGQQNCGTISIHSPHTGRDPVVVQFAFF